MAHSAAEYRASQDGVEITLIVRGISCLQPGIQGLSERIRVISIVGRFLEHTRIFYFRNGEDDPVDGEVYIGSGDWMGRNLHRRVELVIPLDEREHRERCLEILHAAMEDNCQAWVAGPHGIYQRRITKASEPRICMQEILMQRTRDA